MSFECTLVTPEGEDFSGTVSQAILPAHDGLIGILTDRAPLLIKLGIGPLRLDAASEGSKFYLIEGGIAQMKNNRLTILTQHSQPAAELDYQAAQAEYAEAAARKITDEKSFKERERAMQRAQAAQQLAQSGKKPGAQ